MPWYLDTSNGVEHEFDAEYEKLFASDPRFMLVDPLPDSASILVSDLVLRIELPSAPAPSLETNSGTDETQTPLDGVQAPEATETTENTQTPDEAPSAPPSVPQSKPRKVRAAKE